MRWEFTASSYLTKSHTSKTCAKILLKNFKKEVSVPDQMNVTDLHNGPSKEIYLDSLYGALVECFTVILCGYAAGRLNIISQREAKGLDILVRTFSLPSVIFLSLAQLDMSSINWKFLASIFISKSIIFVGVLLVTLCLIRPVHFGKLGLYAVFCTQSNDFALGYPILNALYGKDHPEYPAYVYLLAPISLAFLNPIACVLIEIGKYNKSAQLQDKNDTVTDTDTGSEELERALKSEKKLFGRKPGITTFKTVFLNLITNPIMFMTVLGICGNFIYQYISFIGIVLKAFANIFSTTALFVLGLRMVGSVNNLKGGALITPGVLIITKLLVVPLVTREVVSLLKPGANSNDSVDLSSFGFMYGTFPTAPMVFVLAAQYDLEAEIMSSSLVVCTFLSAPLMYISAKMIFMHFIPTEDYYEKLESFQFNIGVIGIPLGVWLLIAFIANKSFNKIPHKITGFLIISQVILCLGVALHPFVKNKNRWFGYLQLSTVAFGLYSCRLWTCFLAVTLALLRSRSLCFVIKIMPLFICMAWGIPLVLVLVVFFVSFPEYPFGSLINPNFHFGVFQSVLTLIVLAFSFLATCTCLILQHRYQKNFEKYIALVQEINTKDLRDVNETNIAEFSKSERDDSGSLPKKRSKVSDIEEIVPDRSVCNGECENENELCSSKFSCTDTQRELCEETLKQYNDAAVNEEIDQDQQDQQTLRHIVLLLLLVTSMFVNFMLSVWTLVVEDAISGVYIELLFLNATLNTGQICLTFAVFGFHTKSLIVSLTNRWRKFFYGADTIVLTPADELGFETTHVCHQFIAHHLGDCEAEIAKSKRIRLRLYKDCFKGRSLVSWLQAKHLAKNDDEAVQYASHLLEGRVLRHVENRHYFENSDLLYTFKQ